MLIRFQNGRAAPVAQQQQRQQPVYPQASRFAAAPAQAVGATPQLLQQLQRLQQENAQLKQQNAQLTQQLAKAVVLLKQRKAAVVTRVQPAAAAVVEAEPVVRTSAPSANPFERSADQVESAWFGGHAQGDYDGLGDIDSDLGLSD